MIYQTTDFVNLFNNLVDTDHRRNNFKFWLLNYLDTHTRITDPKYYLIRETYDLTLTMADERAIIHTANINRMYKEIITRFDGVNNVITVFLCIHFKDMIDDAVATNQPEINIDTILDSFMTRQDGQFEEIEFIETMVQ
jgi:hypothetical protein